MKTRGLTGLLLLALGACEGTIVPGLTGEASPGGGPDGRVSSSAPGGAPAPWTVGGSGSPTPALPSVATCADRPVGRGYRGFAGEPLEADRLDTAAFTDLHRPFPGRKADNTRIWLVVQQIALTLGGGTGLYLIGNDSEAEADGVGASFGVTPGSWYQEAEVGPFAVYVVATYATKACRRIIDVATGPRTGSGPYAGTTWGPFDAAYTRGWLEHAAFAPEPTRAAAFCRRTQRAAWFREPTAAELQACVDLVMSLDAPDPKDRWSLACASVFASVNFLAD